MIHTRQFKSDGNRLKLLVIDDDSDIAQLVAEVADREGFDAVHNSDPKNFSSLYSEDLDGIIIDLVMPGLDGIELIRSLAAMQFKGALILMSGLDPKVLQCSKKFALENGLRVTGLVSKPIKLPELKALLRGVCSVSISRKQITAETNLSTAEVVQGIASGQFISYYQPKINLNTGEFVGVEALARFCHPVQGIIEPDGFFPVIENAGLMEELTWTLVQEIFTQIGKWRKCGLIPDVSINLSAEILADLDLPEKLNDLARTVGASASQISIEVPETATVEDLGQAADTLLRLRVKGIGISLDDFGTGSSSFAQLSSLPVNELKIDRSFVAAACNNHEARSIVEMTVDLARRLGLNVVAEGVESAAEVDLLRKMGCHDAQGYYFAKPMPGDDLGQWLNRSARELISLFQRY